MIVSLSEDIWERHSRFARRMYGLGSYQSSQHYLHWLYRERPYQQGEFPGLVALDPSGDVVGCIHRMALPGPASGTPVVVVHNLMVSPELRSGLGFVLLKQALRGVPRAVIPGVTGEFAGVYPLLKATDLPTRWLRLTLPWASALRAGYHSVGGSFALKDHLRRLHGSAQGQCTIVTTPDGNELRSLAVLMGATQSVSVPWDDEMLRWRLFHHYGPANAVLSGPNGAVVLAFGWAVRGRVAAPVARLLRVAAAEPSKRSRLLSEAVQLAERVGAYQMTATSTDHDVVDDLQQHGFKFYGEEPRTFVVSRGGSPDESTAGFDCLSSDIGFDGIPRLRRARLRRF